MNRSYKIYIFLFILILGVFVLLQFFKTDVTDWRRNFDPKKKSPYGLFVFNEELPNLLGMPVDRAKVSPYDLFKFNPRDSAKNFLLIQHEIDQPSWEMMSKRIESGSRAFIFSSHLPEYLEAELGVRMDQTSLRLDNLFYLQEEKFRTDSLVIDRSSSGTGFVELQAKHEILGYAAYDGGKVNFVRVPYGRGFIYLHAEPLILTNYYLLKPQSKNYLQSVLSYVPPAKTIWFLPPASATESASPLRFILSQPALRYAWWLLLGGLLLFVIFKAKRKQRAIPVIMPLKNRSVEFVQSISNLYLQEGNDRDMMRKKAHFFLHRVRRELLIDTHQLDEKFEHTLHQKTGKDPKLIAEATSFLRKVQDQNFTASREDLMAMTKVLDAIFK